MAQPFHDSSDFQYINYFPLPDPTYNGYETIERQPWLDPGEDRFSSLRSFYNGIPVSLEEDHLQAETTLPIRTPQEAVEPITTNTPNHNIFIATENFQFHPYYPQYPADPVHLVASLQPVRDAEVVTLQSNIPATATKRLAWKSNDMNSFMAEPKTVKKRKTRIAAPVNAAVKRQAATPPAGGRESVGSLGDYLGLFDTSLTATEEKRRRKVFSTKERSAVRSVRNVGACIQCRFRKKSCSAGRPCPYCVRYAGSTALGAQICHRESPFINRSLTSFFPSSSMKRITDFKLLAQDLQGIRQTISIDGNELVTLPLRLKIRECDLASLGSQDLASILRTLPPGAKIDSPSSPSGLVKLLEPGSLSHADVEQWALDYAYKFCRAKNPWSCGFVFSVEYVARGLPHSNIVTKTNALLAMSFVLRAGLRVVAGKDGTESPFRTIQAQIDTLLFESLRAVESSLYRDLQRLIFRSAGSLSRDAVLPVCLCVWQLSRLQCSLASQLSNISANHIKKSRRATGAASPAPPSSLPNSTPTVLSASNLSDSGNPHRSLSIEAENQTHGLNLLLCTFEALFRSNCPLLLNWDEAFSKELVGNDEHLVNSAVRFSWTLRIYRTKGHRKKYKKNYGYKKDLVDKIRGLLRES